MRKDFVQTESATTGAELREARLAAGVMAWKLAARMGVASPRTSQIEALAVVPDDTARRYRTALSECIERVAV